MIKPEDLFDLSDSLTATLFTQCTFVWEALKHLESNLHRLVDNKQIILGEVMDGAHIGNAPIFIGKGAKVEPGAYIQGPAYIGPGATIRHGAYVRENVIMLAESILGHASEAKNSILLIRASAPHFNYVGDSILGMGVNLGAGTKLSNLAISSEKDKITGGRPTIKIYINDEMFDTGLTKMGAILGDNAQTGCNAVLNPGCIIGNNTLIYPNISLRKGFHPSNSVIKFKQSTTTIPRRN